MSLVLISSMASDVALRWNLISEHGWGRQNEVQKSLAKELSANIFLLYMPLTIFALTVWTYYSDEIMTGAVSFLDWGTSLIQRLEILPERGSALPLTCVAASLCAATCLPRSSGWARLFVALTVVLLGQRYLAWRFFNAFDLDADVNFYLRMLSFVVELLVYTNSLLFFVQTALPTERSGEADLAEKAVLSGEYLPTVDIFIPTYNEDVHMLRRTVLACQSIDYPNKTIYLLDDTRRPHVRSLAEELGCNYCDRPDNKGAKAGNMNNGLKAAKSELVAVFDADFVPAKNFLSRTVGFFRDERTAIVQTPQVFYNPDIVQRNLGVERQVPNEEDLFFRVVQSGRDFWNASICHGTSFVIRRSALDQINGFPMETITEDFFTGIKTQSLGYRLKYLNEPLSAGDSAINTDNYISQRLRWAQGTFQVLFTRTNPMLIPGLNLMQRIIYSSSILYWLTGLCNSILLTMPLLFLYFDFSPVRCSVSESVQYWLPYYAFAAIAFSWFVKGRRSFFWSDVYAPMLAVPLTITFIKTLLNPFGTGFRVTAKSSGKDSLQISWLVLYPLLAFFLLYVGGLTYFWAKTGSISDLESAPTMIIWSVYNSILLFLSIQLCINVKQRRKSVHTPCELEAQLKCDGKEVAVTVQDLCEGGARIKFGEPQKGRHAVRSASGRILLDIPSIGIYEMPINHIRITKSTEAGLAFDATSTEQQRKLVEFVYCQPGRWQDKFVSEIRGAANLIVSSVRLHPFIFHRGAKSPATVSLPLEHPHNQRSSQSLETLTNSA